MQKVPSHLKIATFLILAIILPPQTAVLADDIRNQVGAVVATSSGESDRKPMTPDECEEFYDSMDYYRFLEARDKVRKMVKDGEVPVLWGTWVQKIYDTSECDEIIAKIEAEKAAREQAISDQVKSDLVALLGDQDLVKKILQHLDRFDCQAAKNCLEKVIASDAIACWVPTQKLPIEQGKKMEFPGHPEYTLEWTDPYSHLPNCSTPKLQYPDGTIIILGPVIVVSSRKGYVVAYDTQGAWKEYRGEKSTDLFCD